MPRAALDGIDVSGAYKSCCCCSDVEIDLISRYLPTANIVVISNIHDFVPRQTTCSGRSGILFVGSFAHIPNEKAVLTLLDEVLPLIKPRLPVELAEQFQVHIVGSHQVPQSVIDAASRHRENTVIHGWLSDEQLQILYNRVKVVVAPLLSGAGVKGKVGFRLQTICQEKNTLLHPRPRPCPTRTTNHVQVNQAMKLGVPVVATEIATEGMHATDGHDCLIANSPEEFASKVAKVYTDCKLWQKIVANAYDNINKWFSVKQARTQLVRTLELVEQGPVVASERFKC